MTEAEWLAATDPGAMLAFAADRAGDRKLRLFACACLRRFWRQLRDPRGRAAVEGAERFVDGRAGRQELALAWHAVRRARDVVREGSPAAHALEAAERLADDRPLSGARDAVWAILLRVIRDQGAAASRTAFTEAFKVNLPAPGPWYEFRAPASDVLEAERQAWEAHQASLAHEQCAQAALLRDIIGPTPFRTPAVRGSVLTWNDSCVPKLAAAIHGSPAWDQLPVLADALEEAGCTDADVLGHCRNPGPHVLGCWALDLLLGKG